MKSFVYLATLFLICRASLPEGIRIFGSLRVKMDVYLKHYDLEH